MNLTDNQIQSFEQPKEIFDFVGTTTILNKKTKKPINVSVEKYRDYSAFCCDTELHLRINEFSLGHIKFHSKKANRLSFKENPNYWNKKAIHVVRLQGSYHSSHKDKYKYVGTKLMQCVFEIAFLNKCNGNTYLDATCDSPLFYYKIGMRSPTKKFNEILKECLSDKKKLQYYKTIYAEDIIVKENYPHSDEESRINFGYQEMFLPKNSIKTWHKKILENPILKETKETISNKTFPILISDNKK
jgi:hypothetical protein